MHIPQRETGVIAESLLELLAVARPARPGIARNCVALRVRARKSYHLPFSLCPLHEHIQLANYYVIARSTMLLRGGSTFSEWNYVEMFASRESNFPFLVGFPDYYYLRS